MTVANKLSYQVFWNRKKDRRRRKNKSNKTQYFDVFIVKEGVPLQHRENDKLFF